MHTSIFVILHRPGRSFRSPKMTFHSYEDAKLLMSVISRIILLILHCLRSTPTNYWYNNELLIHTNKLLIHTNKLLIQQRTIDTHQQTSLVLLINVYLILANITPPHSWSPLTNLVTCFWLPKFQHTTATPAEEHIVRTKEVKRTDPVFVSRD